MLDIDTVTLFPDMNSIIYLFLVVISYSDKQRQVAVTMVFQLSMQSNTHVTLNVQYMKVWNVSRL